MNSDRTGPMLLTGKVVLNDGTALGAGAHRARVHGSQRGRPRAEGFTDMKGRFAITLGQENDIMPDASEVESRGTMVGANANSRTSANRS